MLAAARERPRDRARPDGRAAGRGDALIGAAAPEAEWLAVLDAKGVMEPYEEPRQARGWLILLLGIVVFAAFGGVVGYAYYKGLPGIGGEPPLIKAERGAYRRAPDERGGLAVANANSSIVTVLRPQGRGAPRRAAAATRNRGSARGGRAGRRSGHRRAGTQPAVQSTPVAPVAWLDRCRRDAGAAVPVRPRSRPPSVQIGRHRAAGQRAMSPPPRAAAPQPGSGDGAGRAGPQHSTACQIGGPGAAGDRCAGPRPSRAAPAPASPAAPPAVAPAQPAASAAPSGRSGPAASGAGGTGCAPARGGASRCARCRRLPAAARRGALRDRPHPGLGRSAAALSACPGAASPQVERTDTSSGPLFRLQAGPFTNREAAVERLRRDPVERRPVLHRRADRPVSLA